MHLARSILDTLAEAPGSVRFAFHGRRDGRETLDAATMRRRITGYANELRRAGLPAGTVVPIVATTSARLWAAFVGAIAADLVPCILPSPTFKTHMPTYARNLGTLMARYGGDRLVVGAAERPLLAPILAESGAPLSMLALEELDVPGDELGAAPAAGAAEVAFLQHSSGSTGVPRGVALTHGAVLGHLGAYARAIDFDPARDRIASWLPLYHDMGLLTSFLLPLCTAASCDSMPPGEWILDPPSILALMAAERSTLAWWPNFAFALLAERVRRDDDVARLDLRAVRLIVNCSEPVLPGSREAFARALAPAGLDPSALRTCYAMAENVFAATQSSGAPLELVLRPESLELGRRIERCAAAESGARRVMSSGAPIDTVSLRIVDDARAPVEEGVVGEIMLCGPSLFHGYHHLPEATAPVLRDGWYATGDVGFVWQGEVFVLGRKSDLIIVGGRKFYPNDIEHVVSEIAGVKDGRVVAFGVLREEKGTEDVVVLVESEEHADRSAVQRIRKEIKARVLQRVDCAVDHALVLAPRSLVKTTSGKIARRDNRRLFLERLENR